MHVRKLHVRRVEVVGEPEVMVFLSGTVHVVNEHDDRAGNHYELSPREHGIGKICITVV